MESSPLPDQIVEVLKERSIGYLSVLSKKGELFSYPMTFHYSGSKIYFITPVSTAKFKFIKANPAVSFLVDNGKVTTDSCGAMIQGKAKIFSVCRMFLSILSIGPKMVGFARKYPGMLTFYARGKGLPDERKLYKYRIIRISPSKIIYWSGYTFGRYVPKSTVKSGRDFLDLPEDESGVGIAAKLLQSADSDLPVKQLPVDHDWLAELDTTVSAGILSEEERKMIKLYKGGTISDESRTGTDGKITKVEKKLLLRSKGDSVETVGS